MTDPHRLEQQYGTDARLQIRIDTHRPFGVAGDDLFLWLTDMLHA